MEKKVPLKLGEMQLSSGRSTCAFGLPDPECDRPATRHFMWLNDKTTSPSCDEHAAYIHSRDTSENPYEEHVFAGDCGMPGTMWRHENGDEKSYCFWPTDDKPVLAEERVLVGAVS